MAYRKIREDIKKIECDAMVEFSGCCPGILDLPQGFGIDAHAPTIEELIDVTRLDNGEYLLRVPLPYEDLREDMEALYPALIDKAERLGCSSMAVPLLADWKKEAGVEIGSANWAVQEAGSWFRHTELFVYVVIPTEFPNLHRYSPEAPELDRRIEDLQRYLRAEDIPSSHHLIFSRPGYPPVTGHEARFDLEIPAGHGAREPEGKRPGAGIKKEGAAAPELEARLKKPGESFRDMLFRLIAERGLTASQCYNRAGISRQVFAKIRNNPQYQPKKATAVCFAIGLELDLEQTNALLQTAGYSFSPFNEFDIIVEYYIEHGNYDFFDINECLYAYGQETLAV